MKQFNILLFLCVAIAVCSCSTDDPAPESMVLTNQDGQLTASVNSTNFIALEDNASGLLQNNVLGISAQNNDGDTIVLTITSFDGEGSYDLSGLTTEAIAIYLPSGDSQFYNSANEGGSGTLTISSINASTSSITGTFNFVAIRNNSDSPNETVQVNSGVFTNVVVSGL